MVGTYARSKSTSTEANVTATTKRWMRSPCSLSLKVSLITDCQ